MLRSYWDRPQKKHREPRNVMRVGERYGKLVVIEPAGATKSRIKLWLCNCDCGDSKVVRHDHLRNSHTVSCGCAKRERVNKLNYVAPTKEFAWD